MRLYLLIDLIVFVASLGLLSQPALAHRSFFNGEFGSASGSLTEEGLSGQYGFGKDFPIYFAGNALHGIFADSPRDDYFRFGVQAGYESKHAGIELRYDLLIAPNPQLGLSSFGGTLFFRFIRWQMMTMNDELFLNHDDREVLRKKLKAETADDIPNAALLAANFDQLTLTSALSPLGGIGAAHVGTWLRAKLKPYWTIFPSADFFFYDTLPSADPLALRAYSSRGLRLIKMGPYGGYSAIYGCPTSSLQMYSELKLYPMLALNLALTRAALDAPAFVGYSFWIGFDRFLSEDRRWAISPSYEHYLLEGRTLSYFTLTLRYGAATSYLPPGE